MRTDRNLVGSPSVVDIQVELADDDVGVLMDPLLVVLVAELLARTARCMVTHYCTHLVAE